MKGRRQIVDPLTGARVPASSPVAVDTGRIVVGHDTVVPESALDPAGDRFGIQPEAEAELEAEVHETADARRHPPKRGRGPAIATSMGSPAAGEREFEQLNPQIFKAPGFDDVDIHDRARDFMQDVEVQRGKKTVPLGKTAAGKKILEKRSGSAIARGVLGALFAQSRTRRYRDVPWDSVLGFTAEIVDALGDRGPAESTVNVPIAAGLDSPDVVLARVREELGEEAAARYVRQLNAEELRELASRLERAIEVQGEECLSGVGLSAARARLKDLRRWAKNPDLVPDFSCVGSETTEGRHCSFPAILEDIRRIEGACDRDYDPAWAIEESQQACAKGIEAGRNGIVGEPCAIASAERPSRRGPRIVRGRIVR